MSAAVRNRTGEFSDGETATLITLVHQAFEIRESPYLRDAVDAIVDWYGRLPLTRLEEQMEREARSARLARLARERQDEHIRLLIETIARDLPGPGDSSRLSLPPDFAGTRAHTAAETEAVAHKIAHNFVHTSRTPARPA